MPTYVYQCQACGGSKDVVHSMSEIDNPSEATLVEITCPYDKDCQVSWRDKLGMELPSEEDLKLKRIPQAPQIMGMIGGSSLSGKEKEDAIRKERKQRSHEHFVSEIYPSIPKQEKKYFKDKWKKQGKTDSISKAEKAVKKR